MDENTLELLKMATNMSVQTSKLNKHLVTCITIILCTAFIVIGACTLYSTNKMYDYEYKTVNVNDNKNLNENKGD